MHREGLKKTTTTKEKWLRSNPKGVLRERRRLWRILEVLAARRTAGVRLRGAEKEHSGEVPKAGRRRKAHDHSAGFPIFPGGRLTGGKMQHQRLLGTWAQPQDARTPTRKPAGHLTASGRVTV